MKKSIAMVGASTLGVGMVAFGGAGAAVADDTTTLCDSPDDYAISDGTLYENWFMDCVPQFGAGKAEFTVTSTYTLPGDFLPLNDPGVTSTYSGNAAGAAAYFGVSGLPAGFASLDLIPIGSDPFEYLGTPIFPISGVASVLPGELPAGCAAGDHTYTHMYRIDYPETRFTFTQEAGGYKWTVEVWYPATSMFLALSIIPDGLGGNVVDPDAAACLSDGATTVLSEGGAPAELTNILAWLASNTEPPATYMPHPNGATNGDVDLGDFPLVRSALPGQGGTGGGLPGTGAEVSPLLLGAGAAALLAGSALFVVSRVRRRRDAA